MSEKEKNKVMGNHDNELLELMEGCEFVDEVNGLEAEEIRDFISARHELIQLLKYWAEEEIELHWFMYTYGQMGKDWLHDVSLVKCRIGRIARLLRDDEVKKAIEELKAKLCKESQGMDIFLN